MGFPTGHAPNPLERDDAMISYILYSNGANIVSIRAGSPLFLEGDAAGVMYALVAGSAEISINNRPVEQLKPGDIVGEVGLLDAGPRSATGVALTDCEFAEISRDRFRKMIRQQPDFALQVMRVMAERLRRAESGGQDDEE